MARVQLERLAVRRSSQHLLVTGLRGVGKTVLLRAVAGLAAQRSFHELRIEATGGDDTIRSLLRQVRRLVADLRPSARARRALKTLEAVTLSVGGTGFRVERPDAGAEEGELVDLLVDLTAAATEDGGGVALVIDEAQLLASDELGQLLTAVHVAAQDSLPLWLAMAGLPNLVGIVAQARTYAERMFAVASLAPLAPADAARALVEPAAELDVRWAPAAVDAVVGAAQGYPFFLQTWAYHAWNVSVDDPISAADVARAAPVVGRELDEGFFAARVSRVPESERRYLRGLASLGPGPHRSGAVAEALGMNVRQVSALRDRLIAEGTLFAPAYGWVELAVPLLDDYLRRQDR